MNILPSGNTHKKQTKNGTNVNDIKNVDKKYSNVGEIYTYTDKGPYEAKKENKNIGNYNYLAVARELYDLKINNVKKINKKGKNKIGVVLSGYKDANNFLKNKELNAKGYALFIPSKNISYKGIVKKHR